MEIKIINKSGNKLPAYATEGAAGVDLQACTANGIYISPGQGAIIGTGLYMEIPKGYEGQIRTRSGLGSKHGIVVPNSPGTVDSDYRGEIKVALWNLSGITYIVKNGDRVAQMVFHEVIQMKFESVDKISETKRGKGGFGSTGK